MRRLGFAATVALVLVLLLSLVEGLGGIDSPEPDEVLVLPSTARAADRIRVEVLNGAGISGLARQVTEELRARGFDVVYYGNAGALQRDSTTILDRTGRAGPAQELADALGIGRIEIQIDTTLYLEATVVLGPDWPELAARAEGD